MKQERIIWIIIFIIGFGVRSTEVFHPIDRSEWRENDMSSIARNYYRNGMDFFHPQIDWGGKSPGYTESEFPVYPYLIALSYQLAGIWEPAGRIISYLFALCTMMVFFRLSKYLFDIKTAAAVSFFFALSPLLMIISNSIQPESVMFFFYVCAAYVFIRWLDSQSKRYYVSTIILTSIALLCKITAINIGILFLLQIIVNKGWKFVLKPEVILLGVLSIMPSIIWYIYSHRFYILYGNSLGLSNQYAWIDTDFFTKPYFIKGIIKQEVINIWTYFGPFIILMALVSTDLRKRRSIIFPVCWLVAVVVFYFVAARSASSVSYYYYHIFSVPAASMLLGISVIEIYDKYFPVMKIKFRPSGGILNFIKSRLTILLLFVLLSMYIASCFIYLIRTVPAVFKTSQYYECKNSLSYIIPEGSLILASGGICSTGEYLNAYNASYFFYWLDRKGFNICIEAQSIENVLAFKEQGASFYIAETKFMQQKLGFEAMMRKEFKILAECNGIILFEL